MYNNHKSICKCPFCKSKRGEKVGRNNGNFKNGISLKSNYCIDCGKELSHYKAKRCRFCANKASAKRGKNSPHWQGGISFEPYPLGWTKTFKEQIRFRDNYTCQICGCPEVENCRALDVHHIDYDKENISPENLISLCKSCHIKTNFNRKYWTNTLRRE